MTNEDDTLLYGIYPKKLALKVLEETMFWYAKDDDLGMTFSFVSYKWDNSYSSKEYTLSKKSDLRKISLEWLINDPRREPVERINKELREAKDKIIRCEQIMSYYEQLAKSGNREQQPHQKDKEDFYASELQKYREMIPLREQALQRMNLEKYPLSKMGGLLHFFHITIGPRTHTLHRFTEDMITQIIGDSHAVKAKEYQVPEGQVYATIDTRQSTSIIPSLTIKGDIATYILNQEKPGKLKLLRRIIEDV